jgi:amino acid adenylation domain-containing protein
VGQHARERPDDRAVIEVGEGGRLREWSFGQLEQTAGRWAALLLELGVKPGEPVAYQLPNLLDFVAVSLGTLTIGAICEPLMPIFRERELEFMLNASDTRVLIVPREFRGHDHAAMAQGLRGRVASLEHVLVLPDDAPESGAPPEEVAEPTPGMSAQLLFTSGSTGEPKGVLQTHASLNLAARMHIRHFGLTAQDVIYIPSPIAHQTGFLYGMWIALMLGAPQVVQTSWDAATGFEAMQSTGVTFVQAATPFLSDLVRVAAERGSSLEALKTFVATGTAIPRELARTARTALGADVGGAFGTTESCLGSAFVPGEDPGRAWSTDGRALEGITLRITDDDGNELPPGEEGNFEVLTPTMFEGYLNRPELTAEKFVADPFGTAPDGRLYRSGDLVKRLPDGRLVFLGRLDQQVKIRGLRIELGEVESALAAFPGIGQVTVQPWTDDHGDKHLVGYITGVSDDGLAAVRDHLGKRLPSYMIPSYFVVLDEIPLTASGKVDWRRLPAPDPDAAGSGGPEGEPRSETERILLREVVGPMLRTERLGVHDDFFRAGGNSLQAAQLMSAINRRFGVEVALADFFASPTVAHLAVIVDTVRASRLSDQELMEMLENLSDEEVERLLGTSGDER